MILLVRIHRDFFQPELCQACGWKSEYVCVCCLSELTMALTIAGDLCFNPLKDTLLNADGEQVKLSEPIRRRAAAGRIYGRERGYTAPSHAKTDIAVAPPVATPATACSFPGLGRRDLLNMPLLIKTQGKCTTDHISMAGPWLRFRGIWRIFRIIC